MFNLHLNVAKLVEAAIKSGSRFQYLTTLAKKVLLIDQWHELYVWRVSILCEFPLRLYVVVRNIKKSLKFKWEIPCIILYNIGQPGKFAPRQWAGKSLLYNKLNEVTIKVLLVVKENQVQHITHFINYLICLLVQIEPSG